MTDTRQTTQKLKILEYLRRTKDHPNAETVYNEVKKQLPAISLATVYRNLNLLASHGEIIKLEIGNEARFDGGVCNHVHCYCTKCGRIVDVHEPEIINFILKKIRNQRFDPECVSVIIKDRCNSC